jgi:hypothetical protein
MKVEVQDDDWPQHMKGREITIYIPSPGSEAFNKIFDKFIDHPIGYWIQIIAEIDFVLAEEKIKVAKVCDGDRPLGYYSSLRNEHCVLLNGNSVRSYPSNNLGWNPENDPCIFTEDVIYTIQTYAAILAGYFEKDSCS